MNQAEVAETKPKPVVVAEAKPKSTRQVAKPVQQSLIVEQKVYPLPEPGLHEGTITLIEDAGEKPNTYNRNSGMRRMLKIIVRIDDERGPEGEELFVSQTCAQTLSPKGRLGGILLSLGFTLPKATEGGFEMADLENLPVIVNIIHVDVDGRNFANIDSWARPRRKKQQASQVATEVVEDLDAPGEEDIPF